MEEIQKDLETKKKVVVMTDHAAMDYPPFRKNFYCEVSRVYLSSPVLHSRIHFHTPARIVCRFRSCLG